MRKQRVQPYDGFSVIKFPCRQTLFQFSYGDDNFFDAFVVFRLRYSLAQIKGQVDMINFICETRRAVA